MNMSEALKSRQALGAEDTAVNKTGLPHLPAAYSLTGEMDQKPGFQQWGWCYVKSLECYGADGRDTREVLVSLNEFPNIIKIKAWYISHLCLDQSGMALRVTGWLAPDHF